MTGFGYPRRILNPDTPKDVEWMQGCFMSGRLDVVRQVPHDAVIAARVSGRR